MAGISRLMISGVTGSNENTVALVNFNVDFSLLKVSPPREFLDVGNSLSVCRRQEAEEGHIHQTARRLGVIFEPLLPPTPHLLRHYGTRASEIAQRVTSTSKTGKSGGLFAKQAGVDGASIWAAATSSSGALQVHLLACMLARIWDQSDAISIWEELLKSRKTEIKNALEQEGNLDIAAWSAHASLQSITREQLGQWDSSARSWLRTADRSPIVLVRQNQLDQIVSKTRNRVNDHEALYGSVIETWKIALTGVERLLEGSPQEMRTGEILLGLHAWHLYPDINLLGNPDILADFDDPLVSKGGILTIGLVRNIESTLPIGLHWSLPLAHLRFYGDPIKRTGKLSGVQNRISLPEFMQTVLGILMNLWGVNDTAMAGTFEWIRLLHELTSTTIHSHADKHWLALLSEAIADFFKSDGDHRLLNKRLIHAGRVHGSKSLLGSCTAPFFGLSQTHHLFHLLKTQEAKIKFLRDIVQNQPGFEGDLIIRYVHEESGVEEFASAFPDSSRRIAKRSHDGKLIKSGGVHSRWVHLDTKAYGLQQEPKPISSIKHDDIFMGAPGEDREESSNDVSEDNRQVPPLPTHKNELPSSEIALEGRIKARVQSLKDLGENVRAVVEEPLETLQMFGDIRVIWGEIEEWTGRDEGARAKYKWEWSRPYGEVIHYSPLLGDPLDVALFLRMSREEPKFPEQMDFRILQDIFKSGNLNLKFLSAVLFDAIATSSNQCARSLRAIATIHKVYRSLPSATLAIKILESKESLFKADWLPDRPVGPSQSTHQNQQQQDEHVRKSDRDTDEDDTPNQFDEAFASVSAAAKLPDRERTAVFRKSIESFLGSYQADFMDPFDLSVAQSFSCVLLCDSGVFNVPPYQMDEIMAISSGDSLFIAAPLLSDPADSRSKGPKIKHIMGNIGRAGTALLKSPDNPRIRTVGVEQWYFISGENWDGRRRDSFADTSLHLWFTGSSLAIDRKNKTLGERDVALYMLESVVSVHGRGTAECAEWMADLDIMKALNDPKLQFHTLYEPPAAAAEPAERKFTLNTEQTDMNLEEMLNDFETEQYVENSEAGLTLPELPQSLPAHTSLQDWLCVVHANNNYEVAKLELSAIENWMELLHTQTKSSIFLAEGNWQARQAATAISMAKGRKTCILSEEICWACIAERFPKVAEESEMITFIA